MTGVPAVYAVTRTTNDLGARLPWSKVTPYFRTLPIELNVPPVIAAMDCVPDVENRSKVYVRTRPTYLSALCGTLTLGGQLGGPTIDATLVGLREPWRALFGPISDETPVHHKRSNISPTGLFFYYEMALGNPCLIPKIYIPTALSPQSDAHVAQAMSQFVESYYYDEIWSSL